MNVYYVKVSDGSIHGPFSGEDDQTAYQTAAYHPCSSLGAAQDVAEQILSAPVPGGGAVFGVSAVTITSIDLVTSAEIGEGLSNVDLKAHQATDPTKPALVTATALVTVTSSPTDSPSAGMRYLLYPAKPIADHLGELVSLPLVELAAAMNSSDEAANATTSSSLVASFFLPIGWWYAGVQSISGTGTAELDNVNAADYALG